MRQAIPKIPPSLLYTTSPGSGCSLSTLWRYVSRETYRTSVRSSLPGRKFVVLRQISPESAHFGVEWGQSTMREQTSWIVEDSQDAGRLLESISLPSGPVWLDRQVSVSCPEQAAARTACRKRLR